MLTLVVSLVLVVATVYVVPAAVAAYARTGRFGAAFSPAVLRPLVTDSSYATGWLVAVAVSFLAQVVASVVSATGIGVSEFDMGESAEEEAPTSRPAV